MRKVLGYTVIAAAVALFPALVKADTIYTLDSGGFDATADFALADGTITITLTNNLVDQTSDGVNLSGVSFSLDPGTYTIGTGSTLTTVERSGIQQGVVDGWTDVSYSSTDILWLFTNSGANFDLTTIGNAKAPYTLIGAPNGSDIYSNANASITNGVHDPFLAVTATWVLNVAGVTADTNISNVIFNVGTDLDPQTPVLCTGDDCGGGVQSVTPEPTSLILAGCGLLGVGLLRRRKSNRS